MKSDIHLICIIILAALVLIYKGAGDLNKAVKTNYETGKQTGYKQGYSQGCWDYTQQWGSLESDRVSNNKLPDLRDLNIKAEE